MNFGRAKQTQRLPLATTRIYTHVMNRPGVVPVKSPMDVL